MAFKSKQPEKQVKIKEHEHEMEEVSPPPSYDRIAPLDETRGYCVLSMILYHALFILGSYFGVVWAMEAYNWLRPIEPLFGCLFVFISGVSARLSSKPRERAWRLMMFALLLSVVTIGILPNLPNAPIKNMQIWFGVLHLMAVGYFLVSVIKKKDKGFLMKLPPLVGCLVCLVLLTLTWPIPEKHAIGMFDWFAIPLPERLFEPDLLLKNFLMPFGIHDKDFYSWDYFPLFPFLFVFFFGWFMGKMKNDNKEDNPAWWYKQNLEWLGFIGKKAVWFYLLHMPVLYGLFYMLSGGRMHF
ncbi:MAG: DUF1624 domain-containing protein [Oscillospiraceae bacterium]|jgi:uncharacterized membrane protein|nr:DUF1624 domain-containing protein [Oscillospiraceae bacterium]